MFTIDTLWQVEALRPLKKAYETDQMDRRLVVVAVGADVNIAETTALHKWLEKTQYQSIPAEWETDGLDTLTVVHVSKLTLEILRRDPFGANPLTPNSWLNRIDQDRFDAILLAQELGDVARNPTRLEIKDSIKPALEAEKLSSFWSEMVDAVKFAKSGAAPRNDLQKRVSVAWHRVEARRHYDPTEVQVVPTFVENTVNPAERRAYHWGAGNWTPQMTVLRDWIAGRLNSTEDLRSVAYQILDTVTHIQITGTLRNDAHALVREAMLRGKLDDLANHFGYVQAQSTPMGGAFNQAGQAVYGQQVNVGGATFINGSVNTGGGDLSF